MALARAVQASNSIEGTAAPVLVRAAVAHLNLAMIHPFSDGNGRMARALQTLVLARDQIVAPVFSSIEEYLGRNTQAYYDVLAEVGQGRWNPQHDATPWVRFCLTFASAIPGYRELVEQTIGVEISSLTASRDHYQYVYVSNAGP